MAPWVPAAPLLRALSSELLSTLAARRVVQLDGAQAVHSIQPTVAYLHHAYEPTGEWWEQTKRMLDLRRVQPPSSIFGHQLRRFAHAADVIRLEVIQQFGCGRRAFERQASRFGARRPRELQPRARALARKP